MTDAWVVPIGTELPNLQRRIDLPDMVAYAGATWDWHRLHYDQAYAEARLLPGPVVDGQVMGAYLAEQVLDWIGPTAWLASLHFRLRAPVFSGETIRCHGTVLTCDGDRMTVEQTITAIDGRLVAGPAWTEAVRR